MATKSKPPSCRNCKLYGSGKGYVPAQPGPEGGVLLVFEAAGRDEEAAGKPLVGRAGHRFATMLSRGGMEREQFTIHNVLSCRPPNNILSGAPYEKEAVERCFPLLQRTIEGCKPKVIVAGGGTALRRLLGREGITKHRGYVFEGGVLNNGAWIIPTFHPSYIMRGNFQHEATFIYDVQHAVQVAEAGFTFRDPVYALDPLPNASMEWAREYRRQLSAQPSLKLAVDIETPYKKDEEDDLEAGEEGDRSYTILRIGFAYGDGVAMSIPWSGEYMAAIRLLCESPGPKVVWSGYDQPRIEANGVHLAGEVHDGMIAWHVLHSDLPKSLQFVTPWLVPEQRMWKHLSHSLPAYYNAVDADVEWLNMERTEALLRSTGLWKVYEDQVLTLLPIILHMQEMGMPVDMERREEYAQKLNEKLMGVRAGIERAVPKEALAHHPREGYKKTPSDGELGRGDWRFLDPVSEGVRRCGLCGVENPRREHWTKKSLPRPGSPGRKKADRIPNPCLGGGAVDASRQVRRWAKLLPFKVSKQRLEAYCGVMGYSTIRRLDRVTRKYKVTFNEGAIRKLALKHPEDGLFPVILEWRGLEKLASTYIGRVADE